MTTIMGNILHVPENNIVLLPVLSNQEIQTLVTLIEYDLITRNTRSVFDDDITIKNLSDELKSQNLTLIQSPRVTYSPTLKLFNLSFIITDTNATGDHLISINFYIKNTRYIITKVIKTAP